jgi:RNA polymerase sigma-70 factor (ECF subfamily)
VFLKLIQALRSHTAPRHSLRGWLFRVARNTLHDHYGRRFTDTVLEEWIPDSDETEPEAQFIRAAGIRRVRQALRQLSAEQQEVIILRFGNMLDLQETADIMGKNVNTVKSHQLRALQNLRRLLSQPELNDA